MRGQGNRIAALTVLLAVVVGFLVPVLELQPAALRTAHRSTLLLAFVPVAPLAMAFFRQSDFWVAESPSKSAPVLSADILALECIRLY